MTYRQKVIAIYKNATLDVYTINYQYYDERYMRYKTLILADPIRDVYPWTAYHAWKQAWKNIQQMMLDKLTELAI